MFAIEMNSGTMERAASGSITGAIWIQLGDIAFPEQAWNDFAVVILGWWTNEAAALIAGTKTRGEFSFMDGPFSVSIAADREDWKLECTRRRRSGTTAEHTGHSTATAVRDALLHASEAVLAVCDKNGWQSSDIDELRRSRGALAHAAGMNVKSLVDPQL
jgi:hypothetical protein